MQRSNSQMLVYVELREPQKKTRFAREAHVCFLLLNIISQEVVRYLCLELRGKSKMQMYIWTYLHISGDVATGMDEKMGSRFHL